MPIDWQGGLGIKSCQLLNHAHFAKQAWRITNGNRYLLMNTLIPKYCGNDYFLKVKKKSSDSWLGRVFSMEEIYFFKDLIGN